MLARAVSLVLLLASLDACAPGESQLRVDYAPDFDRGPKAVSVVGAYQGGLLRAEAWADLAPSLAGAFGGAVCEPFYSKELDASNPSLASSIDHYTKANGVTDELLRDLAPAATTDTLVLITVGAHAETSMTPEAAPAQSMMPGRRGSRPRPPSAPGTRTVTHEMAIDLSVSFYSIRKGHLVAQMDMSSTGATQEEAVVHFADEMRKRFPSTTCAAWKQDARIDEAKIQAKAEPEPE